MLHDRKDEKYIAVPYHGGKFDIPQVQIHLHSKTQVRRTTFPHPRTMNMCMHWAAHNFAVITMHDLPMYIQVTTAVVQK